MPSDISDELGCTGTSDAVRDRGLDRALIGRASVGNSGVLALTGVDTEEVVELVVAVLGIVW